MVGVYGVDGGVVEKFREALFERVEGELCLFGIDSGIDIENIFVF